MYFEGRGNKDLLQRSDAKGERKSEVKDVSKAFGLSSWKLDGDQCGRSRCGG